MLKTTFQSTCHQVLPDKMAVVVDIFRDDKYQTLSIKFIPMVFPVSQFHTNVVERALLLPVFSCRCFDKKNQIMVNAVKHIHELKETAFGMNAGIEIHGNRVRDLITKFFYRDSHLCFHILLQVDGGETVFFREFTDYAEYKKAFSDLQQARLNNIIINAPKKNLATNSIVAKVA